MLIERWWLSLSRLSKLSVNSRTVRVYDPSSLHLANMLPEFFMCRLAQTCSSSHFRGDFMISFGHHLICPKQHLLWLCFKATLNQKLRLAIFSRSHPCLQSRAPIIRHEVEDDDPVANWIRRQGAAQWVEFYLAWFHPFL